MQANPPQTKCRKRTETLSAYYQLPSHETSLTDMVIPATPLHQHHNWPTLVATNSLKYLVMLNRQWSHSCLKAHRCRHQLLMNKRKIQGDDRSWPCQCHPSPRSGSRMVSSKVLLLQRAQLGKRQQQDEVRWTFLASIFLKTIPRQRTGE
jgi:hypothetical protein